MSCTLNPLGSSCLLDPAQSGCILCGASEQARTAPELVQIQTKALKRLAEVYGETKSKE